MTPKPKLPDVPATPTRADASIITQGSREAPSGFGIITNSKLGKLQPRALTGQTITTGGGTGAPQ